MGEDAEDIAAAVNNASIADDLPEPLSGAEMDDLVAAAATDPGAPFEPDVMARIKATRDLKQADFIRFRARIKATKIVPMAHFDDAVGQKAQQNAQAAQGQSITFDPIEPWPDAVDGDDLLTQLVAEIRRYVFLTSEAAIGVALWIMHAHCFMAFPISARLVITSPTKRCGKTRLLRVVQLLVPKPLPASNITSAAMFRVVEKSRPTLLIDEADTFLSKNEELRGIINSGHEREGRVLRIQGDEHEPRSFSTYCPTALAAIRSVPETIEDRALPIQMRRRTGSEHVASFRMDKATHFFPLKRKIARWIDDHVVDFDDDPPMPPGMMANDRACDNWRPFLAIVDAVGGQWPQLAREAAVTLSGGEDEQSLEVTILKDIKRVFGTSAAPLSSTALANALGSLVDSPWATYSRGKPMTPNGLARFLRRFTVKPKTIKLSDGSQPHGYEIAQFADAFARYLSQPASGGSQSSPSSPSQGNSTTYDEEGPSEILGNGEMGDLAQILEKIRSGELGEVRSAENDSDEDWSDFFSRSQQEACS